MSTYDDTVSSSSYVESPQRDYTTDSTQAMNADYSISKTNIPSFKKILVPDDGKDISNKALNHAIYVSNISGAEIVILRVIGDVYNLRDTSVKVSQDDKATNTNINDNETNLKRNVEGGISKCDGR